MPHRCRLLPLPFMVLVIACSGTEPAKTNSPTQAPKVARPTTQTLATTPSDSHVGTIFQGQRPESTQTTTAQGSERVPPSGGGYIRRNLGDTAPDTRRRGRTRGRRRGSRRRRSKRRARSPEAKETTTKDKPKVVTTWKRAQLTPNTTRLKIGDKEQLPLKSLHTTVRIEGFRARVMFDCYFLNDRNQQYEGTFQLRLPNGASPHYFAFGQTALRADDGQLDLPDKQARAARKLGFRKAGDLTALSDSGLKEARVVPKERAVVAYLQTVRRRVDPALVEWAGAGVFNARVFPLTAKTLHRIVFAYDIDLDQLGDDLQYQLTLPNQSAGRVVDLFVGWPGDKLAITPKPESTRNNGWTHYQYRSTDLRQITLRIKAPGPILLAGAATGHAPSFAARFKLPLAEGPPTKANKRAVFLLDTSLSANPERFNVWIKLLDEILKNNEDQLKEFAVLCFNIESFWWNKSFLPNNPKNRKALREFVDSLALEGATDLGLALDQGCAPHWLPEQKDQSFDLFLLSDGAATWGENDPAALHRKLGGRPLFAYRTGFSGSNDQLLRTLCQQGALFSALGEQELAKASKAHCQAPWTLHKLSWDKARDLLIAGRPRQLYPNQQILIAGRGRPEGPLRIELRRGKESKDITLNFPETRGWNLASRIYGQIAVEQLEDLLELEDMTELAEAYAIHYRVAGRRCSLLMLESEQDYQRFNIRASNEALVVKVSSVRRSLEEALAAADRELGDPQIALLARLKHLQKQRAFTFQLRPGFVNLLKELPPELFAVKAEPILCKQRGWEGIPGTFQEALQGRKLDYEKVAAEARRRRELGPGDALKVYSNLIEEHPGDAVLARDVGYTAMSLMLPSQAYFLFRRMSLARPHEPQNYHALARCLSEMGHRDLALSYYEVALAGEWDRRFGQFKRIVEIDYLRLLRQGGFNKVLEGFVKRRRGELSKRLGIGSAGLVVVLSWNTDNTDVDLHVTEPGGETCYYNRPRTRSGGHITRDVTAGYGPEMYMNVRPPRGRYQLKAQYYASDENRASRRTKVYVTIYRHWGQSHERIERRIVTLAKNKQMLDLMTLTVD